MAEIDFNESTIYDEIEIEDMTFDPATQLYHYPCPCGDRFEIVIDDLRDGQDIAVCPSWRGRVGGGMYSGICTGDRGRYSGIRSRR